MSLDETLFLQSGVLGNCSDWESRLNLCSVVMIQANIRRYSLGQYSTAACSQEDTKYIEYGTEFQSFSNY